MLIGYTRVSKVDGSQSLDLQRDAGVRARWRGRHQGSRPVSQTTPMGAWCYWWRRTRTGRTCPDMSNILFGVDVAILIASLAGAVWSAAVPGRRIWPPPGRRSWQYFLTWASYCAVCGINLLLLLMHWNSWVFQSPLRFVVGIPLALLGGMLAVWGMVTVGWRNTSGLKGGFVSYGPYRFTRNPQYVGDMCSSLAWA